MPILLFIFINSIVIASSILLTYKLLRIEDFVGSLICCFIFYFAQIIFSELALGVLGGLYIKNVLLLNLILLLIVWLITKRKVVSFNLQEIKKIISEFPKSPIILFITSVILCFASVKIFINLMNPPFGWDSLNYHFTFPVEWLKNGNLDTPIIVSDDPAPTYYPINGNLFFLWFILPFKNVFLADLGSLPFFVMSSLTIYAISRMIGLCKEISFLSASMFILIPNFFKQLEIAYVDVMVCTLFLISLYYILKMNKDFQLNLIILSGISLGLLIGTKTLASVYALPLFLAISYISLVNIKKNSIVNLLIFITSLILFGGFSYIRNFIWTGNPVFPMDIKIFGTTVFKGVIDKINYSAHFLPADYKISKLLFHEGLGLQTLLFILPGAVLSLPTVLIKRKNISMSLPIYLLAILPFILYLIWRYIIPLANTRYLYPALAVAMIMGFYIIDLFKMPFRVISILVILCTLSSISELSGHKELIISLITTIILFFLLLKSYLKTKFVLAAFTLLLILFPILERDYFGNEYQRYKNTPFWKEAILAWGWLNDHTQQDNVSYVGRPVPFPLYGSGFKNSVYYTSVNNIDPAKLHLFKNSRYIWNYDFEACHKNYGVENNYRGKADYFIWLNNLRRRKTGYLFVYSLHQTKEIKFPLEDEWAIQHPEVFEPVFIINTIHVYKIK